MPDHPAGLKRKLELIGWLLFVLCALLFTLSSIKNGDTLSLMGSLVFLAACGFFLAPFFWKKSK